MESYERCDDLTDCRLAVESTARLETIKNAVKYGIEGEYVKALTIRLVRLAREIERRNPALLVESFRQEVSKLDTPVLELCVSILVDDVLPQAIENLVADNLLRWYGRQLHIVARELQRRATKCDRCHQTPPDKFYRVQSNQGPQTLCRQCVEYLRWIATPQGRAAMEVASQPIPWMTVL